MEFFRNKYPQSERDKMDESVFCGPHQSFPIKDQEDVTNAAHLIGHADNPEDVKRCIIGKAKAHGWTLPESWQEGGSEERMAGDTDTIERADNQPSDISFYAPFVRVDDQSDKREVVGKATRGTPIDTYKTVVTYEGSKNAFARAGRIPLREMHQPKAVGKGLEWWGDDEHEDLYLHSYISRGAEDTWMKVKEDVLVGYSIKGRNAKYGTVMRNGEPVTAIIDYDLIEVSLVDKPSCPGCDIAIMRGDGIEAVIASDEEIAELTQKEDPQPQQPEEVTQAQPNEIERAGARLSADSRSSLHDIRDKAMQMCGCDQCQAMMDEASESPEEEAMEERVERMVGQSMSAVYSRMQAYLGEFARRQTETSTLQTAIERVAGSFEQVANKAEVDAKMDKVLTELAEVKGLFERIASTPLPGGPHTGRAAQKRLAIDGSASPSEETPDLLRQVNQAGVQLTAQQQAVLIAGSLKRM